MKYSYSKCDICRNRAVPRVNNIMNFLYLKAGSCIQYWMAGQNGQIPTHMCNVVQYYSWDTCGCGIIKPNPVLERIASDFKKAKEKQTR